jgi:hypothetical protein
MRRHLSPVVALATALLVLALPLGAVSAESQRAFAVRLELSGENEVPPAVSDATGTAIIVIVPATDMVCWKLSWEDAPGTVVAAHIHGPAQPGVNAGILVPLTVDPPMGCTTDSDADAIAADPGNYYVNIHSTEFPGGFLRAQLD